MRIFFNYFVILLILCSLNYFQLSSLRLKPKRKNSFKCGIPAISPLINSRVINGIQARPHSWPWTVSIQLRKKNFHFCGGSLITNRHILTAAHCFLNISANSLKVVVGVHSLNSSIALKNSFRISNIKIYPKYNPVNTLNDIAILKLTKKISFSKKVSPICLPVSKNIKLLYNKTVITVGW